MTYTAPELVLIITTVGAVIVNIVVAIRANQKMDKNLAKSTVIEGHVNGDRAKLNEQLLMNQKEIERLKSIIMEKDKSVELVAKAVDAVQIVKELKS